MDFEPNTTLRDRYRIEEQLGKGGMGAVYAAHDTVLDTRVALKVNQNPRPEGRDQFLNEARLLAALRHANLPRVIDYFVIEESQYLVMDYVPGEDLGALVKEKGVQPVNKVVQWAEELGSALSYLHQQNPPVIHRDIKPANIKLTPSGSVMLVDFGIAKAVETSQETSTGARGMTPGYSPPEQYGTARTGPYSDQFSLASTIYNLLTNQKPVDAVERMLGQAVLTPMNLLNPAIPPHVQAAVERGMAVRPEERFPSVQAFVDALKKEEDDDQDERQNNTDASATRVGVQPPTADRTVVGTPVQMPIQTPPSAAKPKKRRALWLVPLILLPIMAVILAGGWFVYDNFFNTPPAAPTLAEPTLDVALSVTQTLGALPTETLLPTATEPLATDLPTNTPEPTDEPTPEPTATPALSEVGRGGLVAFASNEDNQFFQIWTMRVYFDQMGNLINSDKQQITDGDGDKLYPAWSPDGSQIVYSASSGDDKNKLDLYIMDQNGENQTRLVVREGDDTQAVWSPDGSWIVFTSDSRSDGILQLFAVRPDGSDLQRISFDKQEYSPEFSPRNDKLVFVLPVNNARYLWVRNPLNNFEDTETNLMYGRLGYFNEPAWSPDGVWIAYTKEEGRTKDIFVTKTSSYGMEISRLTSSTFDSHPAWSSDSQWLLFNSNRDGNMEIYIMNTAGNMQTNLTNTPNAEEIHPAWQIK